MILLQWEKMTEYETDFVKDLIRVNVLDIVRPEKVDKFIEEGIFTDFNDIYTIYNNAKEFVPHRCNGACLTRKRNGAFRCRKIDNLKASPDNTKHMYLPLPNYYSVPCLKIL